MFMFGLHAAAVGVLLALAPGSPKGLPSADEQKAFADGLRLFEGGDARGAERTWKAGYAAGHDPAFLVRIGEAQEKAGAPQEAVKSYEQYLRESPDAADRADIDARLRRLSPGTARGKAPDDELPGEMSRPGGQVSSPPGGGAAATPSSGGTPGESGGKPDAGRTTSAVGGAHQQVKDDDANEDLHAFVEGEGERSRLNVAGWVGAGVTALLLGAAAFYGAKAAEKAGDANRLLLYVDETTGVPQEYAPHARQYEDIVSQGQQDDRVAKGLAIAAGATAVASAVLFILDGRRDGAAGAGTARTARNERTAARTTPTRSHASVAGSMATSVPVNRPVGAPDRARGLKPDVDVGVGMGMGRSLALGLARGSGSGAPAGRALALLPLAGGINVSLGLAWRF